jgi:predicted GIY-YIG superfamily endonuclease
MNRFNTVTNLPDQLRATLSPSGRFPFQSFDAEPAGDVVYVIWTPDASSFYVGSTASFGQRTRQHLRDLMNRRHNYLMQEAGDRHESLNITVIGQYENRAEAYAAEQRLLDNTAMHFRAGRMNVNPLATGLGEGSNNPGATPVTVVFADGYRKQFTTTTQAADAISCTQPTLMNMMDGRIPMTRGVLRVFRTYGVTSAPNTGRPGKVVVATDPEGKQTLFGSLTQASRHLGVGYNQLGRIVRARGTSNSLQLRYL